MESIMKELRAQPGFNDFMKASGAGTSAGGDVEKQLKATWAMLDKLAKEDPAKYKVFVDKLMKEQQQDVSKARREVEITPHFCLVANCNGPSANSAIEVRPGRHPPPLDLRAGHVVYINVCSLDAIKPPTFPNEKAPTKVKAKDATLETLFNLSIDVAMSPCRRVAADPESGGSGAAAGAGGGDVITKWALDLLVSPWVIEAFQTHEAFGDALRGFLVGCAADDLAMDLRFAQLQTMVNRKNYMGGTGLTGETPLPFKVDWIGATATPPAASSAAPSASSAAAKAKGAKGAITSHAQALGLNDVLGAAKQRDYNDTEVLEPSISGLAGLMNLGISSDSVGAGAAASADNTAAQLAAAFAETLPLEAQLYGQAATVDVRVNGASEDAPSGSITVSIKLKASHVQLSDVKMSQAELDVEPLQLTLRLPRRLLPTYQGLDVSHVLIALVSLPKIVDVDSVRAKYHKPEACVEVTMALM